VLVEIHIEPHPRFEREGDDLVTRATISQPQAALGGEIEVPTLDGHVTMTIPAARSQDAASVCEERREGHEVG